MKSFLFTFMCSALLTSVVSAQSLDTKSIALIDEGSTLSTLTDVLLSADQKVILQNGQFLNYFAQLDSTQPFCLLLSADEHGNLMTTNSIIPRNTKLVVYKIATGDEDTFSLYKSAHSHFLAFRCNSGASPDKLYATGTINIGQFKTILHGVFDLKLAPPKPF